MTGAEYIGVILKNINVTDAFGVPGGVILELLYAFEKCGIKTHLNYNEQSSGFASIGYAQAKKGIGVAYGTKGPGICNMITSIAEAYQESVPVLFITAHNAEQNMKLRVTENQEIAIERIVEPITKNACRVDKVEELADKLVECVSLALDKRKGPVLLDIDVSVLKTDYNYHEKDINSSLMKNNQNYIGDIIKQLHVAKRPLILIGDGIKQSNYEEKCRKSLEILNIPVISSRNAQDIMSGCENYFGYIGSHGIRYANSIFQESDFVIAVGNRMAFPDKSVTFNDSLKNKRVIKIDIDIGEKNRKIVNTTTIIDDLIGVIDSLYAVKAIKEWDLWIEKCRDIKKRLLNSDCVEDVNCLIKILSHLDSATSIVADVGNNEFWLSRAYERINCKSKIFYSKNFGSLGCALGKSIGVYYATLKSVMCICGDQGFQFCMQELQTIASNSLPITIIIINNNSSAMIREREEQSYDYLIHTSPDSGYKPPNIRKLAEAFGVEYIKQNEKIDLEIINSRKPQIIEIETKYRKLAPNIPVGACMKDMVPYEKE